MKTKHEWSEPMKTRHELATGEVLVMGRTIEGWAVYVVSPDILIAPEYLGQGLGEDDALDLFADRMRDDELDL